MDFMCRSNKRFLPDFIRRIRSVSDVWRFARAIFKRALHHRAAGSLCSQCATPREIPQIRQLDNKLSSRSTFHTTSRNAPQTSESTLTLCLHWSPRCDLGKFATVIYVSMLRNASNLKRAMGAPFECLSAGRNRDLRAPALLSIAGLAKAKHFYEMIRRALYPPRSP
jgi:hypothetical protein